MAERLTNKVELVLNQLERTEPLSDREVEEVYRTLNEKMKENAADFRERESRSERQAASISINA